MDSTVVMIFLFACVGLWIICSWLCFLTLLREVPYASLSASRCKLKRAEVEGAKGAELLEKVASKRR